METKESRLISFFRLSSAILSSLVLLIGGLALASWIFRMPAMSMPTPATALALLLLGISLRLLLKHPSEQGISTEPTCYAASAILVGGLALLFNALPSTLQFLQRSLLTGGMPGAEMSWSVSIEILIIGSAVILLQTRQALSHSIGQSLAALASAIAFYACIAAMLGSVSLFHYVVIPPFTAIALLALSLSALFAQPQRLLDGLLCSPRVGGTTSRVLSLAAVISLVGFAWIIMAGQTTQLLDPGLAIASLVVIYLLLFVAAVFYLGRRLNSIDAQGQSAAHRLQQLEQTNAATFESIQESVIFIDDSGRITDWNRQVEKTLGWLKEEVSGKSLSETVVAPAYRRHLDDALTGYVDGKEGGLFTGQHEFELLHHHGQSVPVELSVNPIHFNSVLRFALVLRDLTEYQRLSQELSRTRDQAMESSKLKSEFVANISHEIRTPLNAIIGMSDILMRKQLPADLHDFVDTIHDSADALLNIVNDILDYSKIDAGKLNMEITELDIVALVEGAAEVVSARARDKGLSLSSLVAPDVPRVLRGDPGRLRQVLVNFLTNGVKFTSSGEVVLRATLDDSDSKVAQVLFSVSDTGVGIEPNVLPHVFEPFTQGDGSVTRRYGGTGLGLSISKRLVELMDGQIGADSTPGRGSTFWFKVPMEKPAKRPQIAPTKKVFQDVTMLMVDGPTQAIEIVQTYAASWGIRCERAATGEEALQMMRRRAADNVGYDIALLDFQLTHSDALALAQSIQKYPDLSPTKLILISSFDDEQLIQDAFKAGVTAVLTKPVRQSRLYDIIVNLIMQREDDANAGNRASVESPLSSLPERAPDPENLILVAEDNAVNQKVILLQLKEIGYLAHTVANGREALEALSRTEYALVLMDCQMPEMDGLEATKLIREQESLTGRHIPIVALTAHAMTEDRFRCLSAGMDDYLSKPVKPKTLKEVIDRQLASRHQISPDGGMNVAGSSSHLQQSSKEPAKAPVKTPAKTPADSDNLRNVFGDESTADVLKTYLRSSGMLLQRLDSAMHVHDSETVRKTAHELLGSSASIAASEMAKLSHLLEEASTEEDWNKIEGVYPELQAALERVSSSVWTEYR